MKQRALVACALLTLTAGALPAQGPRSLDVQFKAARQLEEVAGDLNGAIEAYKKIVAAAGSNRTLAANALLRMAECYQKLGDTESRKIYEHVVREFDDQREAAARARVRLAAMRPTAPSSDAQTARLVLSGPDAFGSVRGSISPDGRYLTFLDPATSGLAIRDLKENTSRVLAQASGSGMYYAVFSPDGRRVAYTWSTRSGKDIQFDVRVLSANGGEGSQPRVVYRNEEILWPRPFGWTADGKHLLVLRALKDGTNQITLIGVDDGSARVLKSVPWNYTAMSLSPDGRYVAHESQVGNGTSSEEIFVLATDGSRETKAVQGPGNNSSPLWTPDGSRLLFLSDRTGTRSLWAIPIEDGRPAGPPVLVKADIGRVRLLGITRTGTLHYLAAGVTRANVYIAELDTDGRAAKPAPIVSDRFVNSNSAPTWSPDGQSLAYVSSRQGGTVLVSRNIKTGEERDLVLPKQVQTGNLAPGPRWFPDGRSLLVFGFLANGGGRYYRVDVASGKVDTLREAKGVSGNGGLGASVISHDGKAILYLASPTVPYQGRTNLIRFEIDTTRETVLKSGTFNALALSPDGTQVALHTYDGTPSGCHLEVMSAEGGELREVVRTDNCNPNRMSWSANNDLVFVRGGNTTPNVLWRVPAGGGQPVDMGVSMAGQLMYPQFHPDGSRLTFAVFETGASEVWALENFLPARLPAPVSPRP